MEEKKLIPNSTQTPNILNDLLFPRIPEGEMRCLNYISRRTFGFHKEEDRISFSQFVDGIKDKEGKVLDYGAGVSRPTAAISLKNLKEADAIIIRKDSKGNYYKINLEMDIEKVVKKVNQLRKLTKIGKESLPKQVKLLNLQKKGKKEKQSIICGKPHSEHKKFINFFYEETKHIRGVKPIITAKDGKNLKRVLDLKILSLDEFEQLAVYFLMRFKKFSPSISTFLSSGILNGLMDRLQNDPEFWKSINDYGYQDIKRESDFFERIEKLKFEMFGPKERTQIQENTSREERTFKNKALIS